MESNLLQTKDIGDFSRLTVCYFGSCTPAAALGVPAPKERGVKHTVKKSISLTLLEFNDFISIRSSLVRKPG